MADERPERSSDKAGNSPGDQGHGRRNGRRRSFRGRHGGQAGKPREAQAEEPAESQAAGPRPAARESQIREQRPPRIEEPRLRPEDMPTCPICGKPIYDLSTALSASMDTGEPAHFDCVLDRVAASESLIAGEKLVYLGSGAFGVVEFKDRGENVFTVKRRIQWEKEGEKKDWRKSLSSRIANL